MKASTLITTALRVPIDNYEALLSGKCISTIPQTFIRPGQSFALCSSSSEQNSGLFTLKAWAECESCQAPKQIYSIEDLSRITSLKLEDIEAILAERQNFFLSYFRIYLLTQSLQLPLNFNGQFASLPEPLSAISYFPILTELSFRQKIQQIEKKDTETFICPAWEQIQIEVACLAARDPVARQLYRDMNHLLDCNNFQEVNFIDPDFEWIQNIVKLANRSIEEESKKKSNYQAGTDFEKIVHKSLNFLGFTVNEVHSGGAGGLDLYCSSPYPLVGECKAGKKIPKDTPQQLVRLGGMRIDPEHFLTSAKLIIGSGTPSSDVLTAAEKWQISIINAMSLQKLVQLKAKYPGAINLFALKEYLKPGKIDSQIDKYIEQVLADIKIRSYIIGLLRKKAPQELGIDYLWGAYDASNPPESLSSEELRDILIELSSPLTGYLGRKKGTDGTDRFYFLRDLPIDFTLE